jgi:hypothetical protein
MLSHFFTSCEFAFKASKKLTQSVLNELKNILYFLHRGAKKVNKLRIVRRFQIR